MKLEEDTYAEYKKLLVKTMNSTTDKRAADENHLYETKLSNEDRIRIDEKSETHDYEGGRSRRNVITKKKFISTQL